MQPTALDLCAAHTTQTCLQRCPVPSPADFGWGVHLVGGDWKKPVPEMVPRCHLFPAVEQLSPKPRPKPGHKGASLSVLPSQNLSWVLVQAMTQKQPPTFTTGEAVDVCGSGEVYAHLVKFSPQVFPQMSDISRATSIPDIACLHLLSHDEFGSACVPICGSPEFPSWHEVKADGMESGLGGSGRILCFDFSGNKISSTEHGSEMYTTYKAFPRAEWI